MNVRWFVDLTDDDDVVGAKELNDVVMMDEDPSWGELQFME